MAQVPQNQTKRVQHIIDEVKSEFARHDDHYTDMLRKSAATNTELDRRNHTLMYEKAALEQLLRDRQEQIDYLMHQLSLEKQKVSSCTIRGI